MKTIQFTGVIGNAAGCALSLILFQGGTLVWIKQLFSSFNFTSDLPPGNYTLNINGITQGNLSFIKNGTTSAVTPQVPAKYSKNVSDVFHFTV
jgi:hypothetical protein